MSNNAMLNGRHRPGRNRSQVVLPKKNHNLSDNHELVELWRIASCNNISARQRLEARQEAMLLQKELTSIV